jgi:hypothetical protein
MEKFQEPTEGECQGPFDADHRMNVQATTAIANLALASGDRVKGTGAFSRTILLSWTGLTCIVH